MKIKTLYLKKFGKFTDRTVKFDDGMNIVYGFNESGKSTLAYFIIAMLFGEDRGSGAERFAPWKSTQEPDTEGMGRISAEFGGSMDFEHNGVNYRITRYFNSQGRSFLLENLDTNRELVPAERAMGELFPGLDRKEYLNSYFCVEKSKRPGTDVVGGLKKHMTKEADRKSMEVDTDYALRVLNDKRRKISDAVVSERLAKLEDIIENEEKTEKKLNEIAAQEIEKKAESEKMKRELDERSAPSLFEENEQEYYRHKERYQAYKKDLEQSRAVSEQLEKAIRTREELETNSAKLERCKEELNTVRIFKKKNKETASRTRQEIESAGRLLLTESKNNLYIQTALIVFAVILMIAGIIMILEEITPFYYILLLAGVGVTLFLFISVTVKWNIKKKNDKEELQKLRESLRDYTNEYELFFRAHSTEEELVARYEEYLKEDGRIPEIIEKETELSSQLNSMNEELAVREKELLDFFRQFENVEDLKDDELVLQEKTLREAKENRIKRVEELKTGIAELKESMIKMHIQVEVGEENETNLLKHKEERKALLEKQKENEKKAKAIELAIKMIENLSTEEHESFGKVINQKASSYAAAFTGNQYTSFITDENLNCKVDCFNRYIPVEDLSNGAEEQMNLALRMSVGDVLLSDYELPLVFDDAFAYYDDERLAETLSAISKRNGQKIIFTCQSREETILNQLNAEYRLVNL